jgi:ribosomal protein S12 methylthiotransferase accessory factor
VSPLTGIVPRVHGRLLYRSDPLLAVCSGELADTAPVLGERFGSACIGTGREVEAAFEAAVGEAAERYSAAWVPRDLVLATAEELGPRAVEPERFALFADEQYDQPGFPFHAFRGDTPVRWTSGWSVATGAEALLPAQLVYLSEAPLAPGEVGIAYGTSNGLACGQSQDDALARALFEVLERDAFMITWTARLSFPRLVVGDDERAAAGADRFSHTAARVSAIDLSAFHGLPIVLGVVEGSCPDEPALAVGAGCAPDGPTAWFRAVSEAFLALGWARGALLEGRAGCGAASVVDFEDHVRLYADPDWARRAAFLTASPDTVGLDLVPTLPGASASEWVDALVSRLAGRGLDVYAVDVTAPDIRAAGLTVVRVLVPGLCPLDANHRLRFLGGERLRRVPFELGFTPAPLRLVDLNPDPHPFP